MIKTYQFSLRIIEIYQKLSEEREYTLSRQLLKSGTSIGANSEEAQGAISNKDFIAKLQVYYKEAKETHYLIRLLRDSKYLQQETDESLLTDC